MLSQIIKYKSAEIGGKTKIIKRLTKNNPFKCKKK